jgi:hypothetical protein
MSRPVEARGTGITVIAARCSRHRCWAGCANRPISQSIAQTDPMFVVNSLSSPMTDRDEIDQARSSVVAAAQWRPLSAHHFKEHHDWPQSR